MLIIQYELLTVKLHKLLLWIILLSIVYSMQTVILRMISFGCDYYWAHQSSRFDQEVYPFSGFIKIYDLFGSVQSEEYL